METLLKLRQKWDEMCNKITDKLHPYISFLSRTMTGDDDETLQNKNGWTEEDRKLFEEGGKYLKR